MMTVLREKSKKTSTKIDTIGITSDSLTSRGGLAMFVRYISKINLLPKLEHCFGRLKKNAKGADIVEMFTQLICFFMDGTSRHLIWFDTLKEDEGYARGMETNPDDMVSSHQVKRFFQAFSWPLIWSFRPILQHLFIWRLKIEQPEVVVLGIDTMVMDNNKAKKRHGVQPTYKKVTGFQPLQMNWGPYIVDAVFRGGKKHSNHGDSVAKMVMHMVAKIRTGYKGDVPIVVVMDSGFFDQKLFYVFELLKIGYICGGRLSEDVKNYVKTVDSSCLNQYYKGDQIWDYLDFGHKLKNWDRYRRAVFSRPRYEDKQALLEFARPDTVIYTNLGMGQWIDERLAAAGKEEWLSGEGLIGLYHGRGRDELVNRALKDFGFEELPFKRFSPNAAFYYVMLLAFFLSQAYKEDVLSGVTPPHVYSTTLRRRAIDFAAKIVRHGGKTILKITQAIWDRLNLPVIWERSGAPPQICWE